MAMDNVCLTLFFGSVINANLDNIKTPSNLANLHDHRTICTKHLRKLGHCNKDKIRL